jgi:hypothetical protein
MPNENAGENELKALEAYLGDKVTFTLPEAAKIFGRSIGWARKHAIDGKLKTVWIGGQRRITRPAILEILTRGVKI